MQLNHSRGRDRDKAAFWQEHLERWQSSGLSQSQYCRQEGLRWHSFHYWRKKLGGPAPRARLRLVPLGFSGEPVEGQDGQACSGRRFRVLVGGLTLEADENIDPEVLKRLVIALVSIPCGV